jgi:hypothetical protein
MNNWLYIANTGSGDILRMDITTGAEGANLGATNFEGLAKFKQMTGVTYETPITGLNNPSGIAHSTGRLVVSENGTGDILIYNIEGSTPTLVGKIATGASSIMGLEIGPDGKIWYVDYNSKEVVRIDNNSVFPVGLNDITLKSKVRVTPTIGDGHIQINLLDKDLSFDADIKIFDVTGALVYNESGNVSKTYSIDLSNKLQAGFYLVSIDNGEQVFTEKVVIQ